MENKSTASVLNIRIAGKPLVHAGILPFTPLGALSVAGALEQANFAVKFFDYLPFLRSVSILEADLLQFLSNRGRVLAISTIFVDLPFLLPALERLKAEDPGLSVILGGPGVTGIGAEILRTFPSIDAVVEGEGELTCVEVVRYILGLERKLNIPGAVIRHGKEIIIGHKRVRSSNLNGLSRPSYHLMPNVPYMKGTVASSRRCKYSCSFCSIPSTWGNRTTLRSIEILVNEIEVLLRKYSITHFSIVDDVFTLSKKRVESFCQEIAKRGLEITWDCFGRIELFDPFLLALMVENGLVNIYYGVESGSDVVLAKLNKGFTVAQALKNINVTRSICPVTASFIWGFPFESIEDFKQTLSFIEYLAYNKVEIQQSALCPLPGTPLFAAHYRDLIFSLDMLPNATGLSVDEVRPKAELIRNHPELFAGFYQVSHPSLAKKWEIANQLGLVAGFGRRYNN